MSKVQIQKVRIMGKQKMATIEKKSDIKPGDYVAIKKINPEDFYQNE